MAGRGPAPKDPTERRRRNSTPPTVTLVDDGEIRGPGLPDDYEWPARTVKWWDAMRSSPQAQTYTDADWEFLLDTAVLHAEFWMGNRSLAAELRLRVAKFGVTPEDRARLRLSVGKPSDSTRKQSAPRLKSKAADERKGRLLKAVGDE